MLNEILSLCELNESEQVILLYLLGKEEGAPGLIAKRTGLKRPTVYAGLAGLEIKGLITKKKKGSNTFFSIIPLEMIPTVLKNHAKKKFEQIEQATEKLTPLLEQHTLNSHQNSPYFDVKTFENSELFYAHLEKILVGGTYCAIFNPETGCTGPCQAVVVKFLEHTALSQPLIKEIVTQGPMTEWYKNQIKNPNHLLKKLPQESSFFSDIILTEDSLIINLYGMRDEKTVKITHKDLYESMKNVFDVLWDSLDFF